MAFLPTELISHIMSFLSFNDRKEASLVCKTWYTAYLHPSLQKNVIVKCKPPEKGLLPQGLLRRRLTHIDFGEGRNDSVSEQSLVYLLKECPGLMELDLSGCNHLFLSGCLLDKELDRNALRKTLLNLKSLKLKGLRHMSDITFLRLVSVLVNLEKISLASTNIMFGAKLTGVSEFSSVMFQFSTFLKFVKDNVNKIKSIDLSFTAVTSDALDALASIHGLCLDELILRSCIELSDKGIKYLVTKQKSLKFLDLSECKELGISKAFFSTLANNLPQLHTLMMRKCVKISGCDISSIGDFKAIAHIDFGEVNNFNEKDLIKGLCSKGPRLSSLALPFCPEVRQDFIFQLSSSNYLLTSLDLTSCNQVSDEALQAVVRSLTLLRSLKLSYCRAISDFGVLGYIPEEGIIPGHTFDFDHVGCSCTREHDSKIFRKLNGVHKEETACMSVIKKSVEKEQPLHKLSNLTKIELLDLSSCVRITHIGFSEAVRFQHLKILSLNNMARVVDSTIAFIAHYCPNLEEVNVRATKVTDKGVNELVCHCHNLTRLDISQCDGVTSLCLETVAKNAKRLHHLNISYTNTTPDAVKNLEAKSSYLKILFMPYLF